MPWKKLLALVTGSIDEELRLRNEYLVTENRILRSKLNGRPQLKDEERRQLAIIGKQLGRKALVAVATIVKPDTILRWKLVARKFNGQIKRKTPGRPPVSREVEALILKFARENRSRGYDRIAGALKNLGHYVSDTAIANFLKRNGLPTAPERQKETTWKRVRPQQPHGRPLCHRFLHNRSVVLLQARHLLHTLLHSFRYKESPHRRNHLHDRDSKFCEHFDGLLRSVNIEPAKLTPHSPNLNPYAGRFVLSVKSECLDRLILFGEKSRTYVLNEYITDYHLERNHQGIGNP